MGSLLKWDVKNEKETTPTENPMILDGHISPPVPATICWTPFINIKDIGIAMKYGNHQPLPLSHSNLTGPYI
jgi:hypothetical protein|tara:strand:- start:866 stop:1081 length:216 start_codon:yes stop_codon:yes gene_type:complete